MDTDYGCGDEPKPLKTNATGGYLAYHLNNTKLKCMYDNRLIPSPDIRNFYRKCQPSSVASYHSSAMSAVMIHCRKSYYNEQWIIVVAVEDRVNHGRAAKHELSYRHFGLPLRCPRFISHPDDDYPNVQ